MQQNSFGPRQSAKASHSFHTIADCSKVLLWFFHLWCNRKLEGSFALFEEFQCIVGREVSSLGWSHQVAAARTAGLYHLITASNVLYSCTNHPLRLLWNMDQGTRWHCPLMLEKCLSVELLIENIFLNRFEDANEKWKSKKWFFLSKDQNLCRLSTQCPRELRSPLKMCWKTTKRFGGFAKSKKSEWDSQSGNIRVSRW